MTIKDEGICRFCLKTFAGRSIGRHLTTCTVKKQKDQEEAKGKKPKSIYHLKIWSYKPYWLHVEMDATAKLYDLDSFLRQIWLECCGHLSEFRINGIGYSAIEDDGGGWGMETESMNVQLKKVLGPKDTFEYEYDFGSTTELAGQVFAQREGVLKDKVRILARNNPPKFDCADCSNEATQYCVDCDACYCEPCLGKHACGDEMALPVVNSPRMGVCGYYGDHDFDDFSVEK
jgi:hypothetical protein